jgi:hypothetical protein
MGLLDRILGSPQNRFAREVLAELHRVGIPETTYEPDDFAIRYRKAPDDGDDGQVFLHNVYRETRDCSRDERRERVRNLIANVVRRTALPQGWANSQALLRPVLRSASFGRAVLSADMALVSRPALPFLHEFVVIDQPSAMAYVTHEHRQQWDVPVAEIFATAQANLARLSVTPITPASRERAMLRFVDSGDDYFTSRLLLRDWVAMLGDSLGGQPVIFAPDRDNLIALRYEPEVLPTLFQLVEREYQSAARSLSPQAYTVASSGAIVPLAVPEADPLAGAVRRAGTVLASSEYDAQSEWMSQKYTDLFVAACTVVQRPDGSLFTVASWADGVESLLPQADFVAFTGGAGGPFFVAWPAVVDEVDLEPVLDVDPARYRVLGWPQASTMERLRARASQP